MGSSKLETLLSSRWRPSPAQEHPTPTPAPDRPVAATAARAAPQPAAGGAPPSADSERLRTGANACEQGRTSAKGIDTTDTPPEREVAVTIRAQALGGELLQVVVDPDYWKEYRAEIAAAPGVPYFVDELIPLLEMPLEDFRLLHEVKKLTSGTVIPEGHPQHAYHQQAFRTLGGDGPMAGSPEAITAERRAKRWFPYAGQEKDLQK